MKKSAKSLGNANIHQVTNFAKAKILKIKWLIFSENYLERTKMLFDDAMNSC